MTDQDRHPFADKWEPGENDPLFRPLTERQAGIQAGMIIVCSVVLVILTAAWLVRTYGVAALVLVAAAGAMIGCLWWSHTRTRTRNDKEA